MKTKLFILMLGAGLMMPICLKATPGGGQEGHGGFVYYYTSAELLDQAKLLATKDLSALEDSFFSAFAKPIDKQRLIDLVRGCRQNPQERKYRINPDGNREELMFNYVVDANIALGGYIEALAPFFEQYAPFQKSVYDRGTMDGLLISVKENLIHEALHLFQYDEVEAKDLSYLLSSWFITSPVIKNKVRYVSGILAIKRSLQEMNISLFRGWEETKLFDIFVTSKIKFILGTDEYTEEYNRLSEKFKADTEQLQALIQKNYTFAPKEKLVIAFGLIANRNAHDVALQISKAVDLHPQNDQAIVIVNNPSLISTQHGSQVVSMLLNIVMDVSKPYLPTLVSGQSMTLSQFLDAKTSTLDKATEDQYYLTLLERIHKELDCDIRGYILMNEFKTFGEMVSYILSGLENYRSPQDGRIDWMMDGLDNWDRDCFTASVMIARLGGSGLNTSRNISRLNQEWGDKLSSLQEVILNIENETCLVAGDFILIDIRTSKENQKYIFIKKLTLDERNWLVDQGVLAPVELVIETVSDVLFLALEPMMLIGELASSCGNGQSPSKAFIDSGEAIWDATKTPFYDLYDAGNKLCTGDPMRCAKAVVRFPLSVAHLGTTIVIKTVRMPVDVVKSLINWKRWRNPSAKKE